jgi:hypothetical protein
VAMPRLRLDALGVYRSSRFADEANTSALASGWNGALHANWETADKHYGLSVRAENLLSRSAAGLDSKPLFGLQFIWRP